MHSVTLLLAVVVFVGFWWARRSYFATPPEIPPGRFPLRFAGPLFGIVSITLIASSGESLTHGMGLAAAACFTASAGLFGASVRAHRNVRPNIAGIPGAPEALVTSGPYGMVRHPFYTAYMLFWIGCAIASPRAVSMLIALVMFFLYLRAALVEESTILQSPLGETYAQYAKRTRMFFPYLRRPESD